MNSILFRCQKCLFFASMRSTVTLSSNDKMLSLNSTLCDGQSQNTKSAKKYVKTNKKKILHNFY